MRKKIAAILVILALLNSAIMILGERNNLICQTFAADRTNSKFQNETKAYERLPTDINGDGIVDHDDIKIAVSAFGAKLGNERYNPIADLNNNSKIDMKDIARIAKDFGKTNYRLTISVNHHGITDPGPGAYGYTGGIPVNITAIPISGWRFDHWSGDAIGSQNPITVTMESHKSITAHFAPPEKIYGINFGPYTKEKQNPNYGTIISEQQIRELLMNIRKYTTWVKTYGCTAGLEVTGRVAHELGLKIAVGAWLGRDSIANEKQITNLIKIGKAGEAEILIVGCEVLLRNDLTEEELIEYINRVRTAVPGIPVTFADVYGELLQHPSVINACDIVLVNIYPVWEGISLDNAIFNLHMRYQQIKAVAAGKQVIIGETGWPSEGNPLGEAVPSPENAGFYFLNFVSWAKAENVSYFYFEAFDEPWKVEASWGPHWGVWTKDGFLKPGMERVFNGETIPDNWSGEEIIGGPGTPSIEFTHIPPYGSWDPGDVKGQVWHIKSVEYRIAVFIKIGSWWTKPYWNNPLTLIRPDGTWTCDITTGGIDDQAIEIIAFLLPVGYDPPLLSGAGTLPQELYDNAIAHVLATRTPI